MLNEFGDVWATFYDRTLPQATREAVDEVGFLAQRALAGPVIEIGAGTGRVAVPLARCGVRVLAVEISEEMVRELRQNAESVPIEILCGDFLTVDLPRSALIYCAFGTIMHFSTQRDQIACFARAAELLTPEGVFVLEAELPNFEGYLGGRRTQVCEVDSMRMIVDEIHQPADQRIDFTLTLLLENGRFVDLSATHRYAYPDEYDLMAAQCGLRLAARYSDWRMSDYTSESRAHISCYVPNV